MIYSSSRTALTEKQVKNLEYANAETMFYENTTVCIPAQYAADQTMSIKTKEGNKDVVCKVFYAYILDINGNLLEEKYITKASLTKEALAVDEEVVIKVKEYNGRYWSELRSDVSNFVGKRPTFESDKDGYLYLKEPICFKVGSKRTYTFADLIKNSKGEYEHKHDSNLILSTTRRRLHSLVTIANIDEYIKLPSDYPEEMKLK